MRRLSTIILGLTLSVTAIAQPGIKNFDVANGFASSSPVYLVPYKGLLYFYGNNGSSGRELHSVSGANNAQLIKNINPSSANAIRSGFKRPIAGLGGKVYFTATNGASGEELFSYDGVNAPKLVADLTFNTDSSAPDNFVVLNSKLYFSAWTPTNGLELYEYDTVNAPKRLTDINAGADNSVFGPMVEFGSKIFFVCNTTANGSELWSYNPLTNTAAIEADIDTGANSSNPANLTVIGNKLYFSATTFLNGRELYVYDNSNPPQRLTDISASALSGLSPVFSNAFAEYKGKIYFAGRDTSGDRHLWSYDPSNSNVTLEAKVNPNGSSEPREFTVYNNQLFFTADDGANGYELFAYDGTNPPVLVADLCAGAGSSLPSELTVIGDELYFAANDCKNGTELMSYNHKRLGVQKVLFDAEVDIYPNPVRKDLHIDMKLKNDEQLRITLADATGRVVYDGDTLPYRAGKNNTDIPMKNMPPGNYIYYIRNAKGTAYITGKVVKQ